jgi:hypothetical protein
MMMTMTMDVRTTIADRQAAGDRPSRLRRALVTRRDDQVQDRRNPALRGDLG